MSPLLWDSVKGVVPSPWDTCYIIENIKWRQNIEVKWSEVVFFPFDTVQSGNLCPGKSLEKYSTPNGGGTFVPLSVKWSSDRRRRSTSLHRLSRSYQFCTIPLKNVYSQTSACRFRLPTHRVLIRIFTQNREKIPFAPGLSDFKVKLVSLSALEKSYCFKCLVV